MILMAMTWFVWLSILHTWNDQCKYFKLPARKTGQRQQTQLPFEDFAKRSLPYPLQLREEFLWVGIFVILKIAAFHIVLRQKQQDLRHGELNERLTQAEATYHRHATPTKPCEALCSRQVSKGKRSISTDLSGSPAFTVHSTPRKTLCKALSWSFLEWSKETTYDHRLADVLQTVNSCLVTSHQLQSWLELEVDVQSADDWWTDDWLRCVALNGSAGGADIALHGGAAAQAHSYWKWPASLYNSQVCRLHHSCSACSLLCWKVLLVRNRRRGQGGGCHVEEAFLCVFGRTAPFHQNG